MTPPKLYIARDYDGMLYLFAGKPKLHKKTGVWHPTAYLDKYRMYKMLKKEMMPEVTFDNSPREVVGFILKEEKL